MANTFNMLRANDLIWSFVINNYLLGKEPFPFDLLYWNSDCTRMPARDAQLLPAQHVSGERADRAGRHHARRRADRPAKDPHPDLSAFDHRGSHRALEVDLRRDPALSAAGRRFVLAGSGHIAGVINPPAAEKYGYWTNEALPADPKDWLEGATAAPGLMVAALAGLECTRVRGARFRRVNPATASSSRSRTLPGLTSGCVGHSQEFACSPQLRP